MEKFPYVKLFDIPISKMDMDETVQYLTDAILQRRQHQVITANPIMVMMALEQPEHMQIMQSAELIVPDGTGIVWAAKRAGNPVRERVAGYDLLHELMKIGETYGWSVYLLGAAPEVIAKTAENLEKIYPKVQVAGYHHGYFTSEDDDRIVADIRDKSPQLLFVASQLDKQEPWIHKYRDQLGVPLMMGIGGSFDVIAGTVKRAPRMWQKVRLEWLYRALREPVRFRRLWALPRFVFKVLRNRTRTTYSK